MKRIKIIWKKICSWLQWLWLNMIDIAGFFRNAAIWLLADITKPRTFTGFGTWWFATRFANKRSRKWKSSWDQSGRQQGLFPVNDVHLLVASKMELKNLKKAGYVQGNPRKILKRQSYYTTNSYQSNGKKK